MDVRLSLHDSRQKQQQKRDTKKALRSLKDQKNSLTRLNAIQLMACSCAITMLNPNLLFIIARRHMMQTWMSSVASPIFNFVECRSCLAIRGPSKSLLWWLVFLRELLPKRGFLDTDAEPFMLILQSSLPELEPKRKYISHNIESIFFQRECFQKDFS